MLHLQEPLLVPPRDTTLAQGRTKKNGYCECRPKRPGRETPRSDLALEGSTEGNEGRGREPKTPRVAHDPLPRATTDCDKGPRAARTRAPHEQEPFLVPSSGEILAQEGLSLERVTVSVVQVTRTREPWTNPAHRGPVRGVKPQLKPGTAAVLGPRGPREGQLGTSTVKSPNPKAIRAGQATPPREPTQCQRHHHHWHQPDELKTGRSGWTGRSSEGLLERLL